MKTVEIYNDELRAGTWIISDGFKRRHAEILRMCRKYQSEMMEFEEGSKVVSNHLTSRKIKREKGSKGGKPVVEYMLNEGQVIFLGTLFRAKSGNDPVLRFKMQLSKDFVKQKKLLLSLYKQRQSPEWIENRATGKIARKEETDTIKDFVAYAKKQGSKSADKYYLVLSACVNNNMFEFNGKFKNKRDAMTAIQLMDVKFADKVVSRGLLEGMAEGLPYKEVFQFVKKRLVSLAEMYGKSEVVSKQLTIE